MTTKLEFSRLIFSTLRTLNGTRFFFTIIYKDKTAFVPLLFSQYRFCYKQFFQQVTEQMVKQCTTSRLYKVKGMQFTAHRLLQCFG